MATFAELLPINMTSVSIYAVPIQHYHMLLETEMVWRTNFVPKIPVSLKQNIAEMSLDAS